MEEPTLGTQFLLVLVVLLIAIPTLLVIFSLRHDRQAKIHQETQQRERAQAEINRLETAVAATRNEANRIGRELHDRVGNHVSALSTELHLLHEHPEAFDPALSAALCESISAINREIRTAAHTFSGHTLRESGLVKAMRDELNRLEKTSKLRSSLAIDTDPDNVLTDLLTDHLYNVFLEAVWNVHKHAAASQLTITLVDEGQMVSLTVADNGTGFLVGQATKGRMGLQNIRARARLAGGTAVIQSTPGVGTTIHFNIPKHA